ncbi:SulP family inorganic anion transporter [Galbibacter sp. BG1]|uniref:SulP family inorganic anion transporter n=1 Tax=Galbibacter sp. BG1 TaxID=1170699 RepID=UPI0015B8163C|nr:SulP family inorganic anion transporter [Galbibacter sp. BG1]QLE01336.1 SulP family inorganic anion transporter [Galbibacter sp. BG1]
MFKYLKNDLPASIVVFFVALPLCLGIALASGAPLFSGLIAGIVGGIVVGAISGSQIGVSGPAAGLAVIVLAAIASLGFENFLVAVVIGGAIQILLGVLKAGIIGYYFPSSVIKGMLAGIGIIIFLKQIPHAFGYDSDYEGDLDFFQLDGGNTFSALGDMFSYISPGAVVVSVVSLGILLLWELVLVKKSNFFKIVPGPLVAVVFGVLFYLLIDPSSNFKIAQDHLVTVPVPDNASDFIGQFSFPNFAAITNLQVWITGVTIAIVASLETLLCVEATDKLDPEKRVTPTNRELFAQGTGNIVSGLIGGIPVTQVIVRSSANIQSGAKTKLSAIVHGFFLLSSVILIPTLLNKIPLAVLAAILLVVGYKLAKPALFRQMWRLGKSQFLPFIVTVLGVVFTDLLMGIGLGLAVGITVILIKNYQNSHFLHIEKKDDGSHLVKMTLAEEVSFLNKGAILKELNELPKDTLLELDVTKTIRLNYDILEILDDFAYRAKDKNIDIKLISDKGVVHNPKSFTAFFMEKRGSAA